MRIFVEGWRFVPHSFAIANQFQLLELLRRDDVELFHRDMPYFQDYWKPESGLFSPEDEAALNQIPAPPKDLHADATLRMFMPYILKPATNSRRTYTFATTEWGIVQQLMVKMMRVSSFQEAHANSDTVIITPSHWSKQGLVRGGADPDRVVVVPHGVDTRTYRPLSDSERASLRRQFGLEGTFVFLNIGIMTWNKGIRPLLKAFARVTERYPQARLILKGTDAIRKSREFVVKDIKDMLDDAESARVIPRLAYIGQNMSSAQLAKLHQAADAYVSPYVAEGFNMPVLEAMACGLPVICTKGGATDDFTRPEFALYIDSQLKTIEIQSETRFLLHPSLDHLTELMQWAIAHPEFGEKARQLAPQFVESNLTWTHIVDLLLHIFAPTAVVT